MTKIARAINIDDLRSLAHSRLPQVVFDYIDGGAEAEVTMRENRRAFEAITFRPRQAVSNPTCDLRTRVLGHELSMPILLAPVGYCRVMHPDGEIGAARAAGAAGTASILSTVSGHRLEAVKAATTGPVWYQLYLTGGREPGENALRRARAAGYAALVISIDTNVLGLREREARGGMEVLLRGSPWSKIPYLPQFFAHPRWLTRFLLDGGLPTMPNIVMADSRELRVSHAHTALRRGHFVWDDLRWIRELWPGPIVIKGVLTAEDARRSVDEGAAAIVVSNHGGRQLDGAPASLRVLPEIIAAVDGQAEVLMDGGIRRGSDVIKAICLGARAVLCGRAYAYGLGAAGARGVARALEILRDDLTRTLTLLGCPSISALDHSYIKLL
ncbi:MAG TPA: alpha-hydroxy acid oxidase [Terriglobales bacterium]|jgi:isopentenyl diphosphate isomerase/L-lactate dehydrogenase-like FMN-dependent dehydrogenase|nr:alpha-hydroxy acid oxidase [Terriglobales bacterium]